LLNTDEEVKALSKHLPPVLQEARRKRSWIVVGYSGNDPVFDHLAAVSRYAYNLYWITYKDNPPGQHVSEQLCIPRKRAYQVTGYDADDFFVILAQQLGCFPPNLVRRPFTHVKDLLEKLARYRPPGQEGEANITDATYKQIERAIQRYEEGLEPAEEKAQPEVAEQSARAMEAAESLMAGDYQKVQELAEEVEEVDEELAESTAWSLFLEGNVLWKQAEDKEGEEADQLYSEAYEKYDRALALRPEMYDVLTNWGNALSEQAKSKVGEESDQLYKEAYEKYNTALKIVPKDPETHLNWGIALSDQAEAKEGANADKLYKEAYKKYDRALKFKPDMYEALLYWGIALYAQAKTKDGDEAAKLYKEEKEKYLQANQISPGSGSYNLACVHALLGEPEETEKWLEESWETGHLPSIDYIKKDKDLANLKKEEWFKKFLEKVRKETK
jgi:tetratricopeptide (TPR) repeat protein